MLQSEPKVTPFKNSHTKTTPTPPIQATSLTTGALLLKDPIEKPKRDFGVLLGALPCLIPTS